jgi:HAD superfamily hydrolase (TIGR01450 family)
VAAHLRELGAPAEDHQVVSSSQAGADLLASLLSPGAAVLITGSPALAHEVELVGLKPVHSAEENPVAVVQGFNPAIGWKDLAEASFVLADGDVLWVATNTDMTLPQTRGTAPGNGSLVAAVAAATGRQPLVAGKPEAPLFHAAAKRLSSDRPLVVGDRLDTDILGGNRAGFATVAVLTGIDTLETMLAARTEERPGYIIRDLAGLYEAYPEIDNDGGTYRCGNASATVAGDAIHISGPKDDLDSWRAACAAWWAARPDADVATAPELEWLDQ